MNRDEVCVSIAPLRQEISLSSISFLNFKVRVRIWFIVFDLMVYLLPLEY